MKNATIKERPINRSRETVDWKTERSENGRKEIIARAHDGRYIGAMWRVSNDIHQKDKFNIRLESYPEEDYDDWAYGLRGDLKAEIYDAEYSLEGGQKKILDKAERLGFFQEPRIGEIEGYRCYHMPGYANGKQKILWKLEIPVRKIFVRDTLEWHDFWSREACEEAIERNRKIFMDPGWKYFLKTSKKYLNRAWNFVQNKFFAGFATGGGLGVTINGKDIWEILISFLK